MPYRLFLCHLEIVTHPAGNFRAPFIHGGFPVAAFFILSGYLVSKKYDSKFEPFSWKSYGKFLFSRISKLYGLYVASMIPDLLVSLRMTNAAKEFLGVIKKLLCNLLLIQTLFPNGTSESINQVSWFFSCLVLIYCAFPIFVRIKKAASTSFWTIIGTIGLCLIAVDLLESVDALYASPVFRVFQLFIGMLITELPGFCPQTKCRVYFWEFISVIVAFCAYACVFPQIITLFDTFSCFFLIYILSQNWGGAISRVLGSSFMCTLSKLSGPIFLIHGPVLFLLGRWLYGHLTWKHRGVMTGILCLILVIVLSVIYLQFDSVFRKSWGNVQLGRRRKLKPIEVEQKDE